MQAEFMLSAVRPEQFPEGEASEYAFLGRSNVGKSSLLNCLLRHKNLARTSSSPGCTQVINFYRVDERMHFVDLPGYGYARTSAEQQHSWKRLIESYLLGRQNLVLCLLLLDARRGWMDKDLELKHWLEVHQKQYMVIATKTDKLKNRREQRAGLAAIRDHLTEGGPLPFSAVTGQGAKEIWQAIQKS